MFQSGTFGQLYKQNMSDFEIFKLAVISTDEITDNEVETIFLNLALGEEHEVNESVNILIEHRPELAKNLTDLLSSR